VDSEPKPSHRTRSIIIGIIAVAALLAVGVIALLAGAEPQRQARNDRRKLVQSPALMRGGR